MVFQSPNRSFQRVRISVRGKLDDLVEVTVPVEDVARALLDDPGETRRGVRALERFEGGEGHDHVPDRGEADERDPLERRGVQLAVPSSGGFAFARLASSSARALPMRSWTCVALPNPSSKKKLNLGAARSASVAGDLALHEAAGGLEGLLRPRARRAFLERRPVDAARLEVPREDHARDRHEAEPRVGDVAAQHAVDFRVNLLLEALDPEWRCHGGLGAQPSSVRLTFSTS